MTTPWLVLMQVAKQSRAGSTSRRLVSGRRGTWASNRSGGTVREQVKPNNQPGTRSKTQDQTEEKEGQVGSKGRGRAIERTPKTKKIGLTLHHEPQGRRNLEHESLEMQCEHPVANLKAYVYLHLHSLWNPSCRVHRSSHLAPRKIAERSTGGGHKNH